MRVPFASAASESGRWSGLIGVGLIVIALTHHAVLGADRPGDEEIARLCAKASTAQFNSTVAQGYFRFDPVSTTAVREISASEIEAMVLSDIVYLRPLRPGDFIYGALSISMGGAFRAGPAGTRIRTEDPCRLVKYDTGWRVTQ